MPGEGNMYFLNSKQMISCPSYRCLIEMRRGQKYAVCRSFFYLVEILSPLSSPWGVNTMLTYGNCQSSDGSIGNYNPSNIIACMRLVLTCHMTEWSPILKTACIVKKTWRIINTIVSIWGLDISYWKLSVLGSTQFSSSYALGKLFASQNW